MTVISPLGRIIPPKTNNVVPRFAAALHKSSPEEKARGEAVQWHLNQLLKEVNLETTPLQVTDRESYEYKLRGHAAQRDIIRFQTPGGHRFVLSKCALEKDTRGEWYKLEHQSPVSAPLSWLQQIGLIGRDLGKFTLELLEEQAKPQNMYMVRASLPGTDASLSNATCYEAYPEPELLTTVRDLFLTLETRLEKLKASGKADGSGK